MVSQHHFYLQRHPPIHIQFADSVYCITLQSPAATIRAITSNALTLETAIETVSIKHPLVSYCVCLSPILMMRVYPDPITSQRPLFCSFIVYIIQPRDFIDPGGWATRRCSNPTIFPKRNSCLSIRLGFGSFQCLGASSEALHYLRQLCSPISASNSLVISCIFRLATPRIVSEIRSTRNTFYLSHTLKYFSKTRHGPSSLRTMSKTYWSLGFYYTKPSSNCRGRP